MAGSLPALPPAVSLTGAYVPLLVGNYPVIQGLVIVSAVFVVLCNGIADILLAALDPRVRASA